MGKQSAYLNNYQDKLMDSALAIYRSQSDSNEEIAKKIDKIRELQNSAKDSETRDDRHQSKKERYAQYREIFDSLDESQQLELTRIYGKLNDLGRSARKLSANDIIDAHHASDVKDNPKGGSADKFLYTLKKLKSQTPPASAKEVQEYVDEMMAKFSITPHPTNGTSVEHVKQGIKVENVLADPNATKEDLENALTGYMSTEIVGASKTQAEETEEGLAVLDNIYDAAPEVQRNLVKALKGSGYWSEGVRVNTPTVNIDAWFAGGDGDGNENSTADSLREGISMLRNRIRERYVGSLVDLQGSLENLDSSLREGVEKQLQQIIDNLQPDNQYENVEDFQLDLDELQGLNYDADHGLVEKIKDLKGNVQDFGFHYTKIDIRHDSSDINTTIVRLASVALENNSELSGVLKSEDDFTSLSPSQQEEYIANILSSEEALSAIRALKPKDLIKGENDSDGKLAARVYERLQVIGENPDMSEKLIIANAKSATDVLSSMALLKVTGNEVGNDKAKMNIVTLSESVPDLKNLMETLKKLSRNPEYAQHLNEMVYVIAMVAESDNRRLFGLGAGHVVYETIGEVINLGEELGEIIKESLPEGVEFKFKGVKVFNGGGGDGARGAQNKPTEIGKLHGYYAKKHGAKDLYCPTSTIQGHQARLIFSSVAIAANTMEAVMSQNIYAKAAVRGVIKHTEMSEEKFAKQTIARADAEVFHQTAMDTFVDYAKNPSFDKLLESSGAWVSAKLNNVSSRSNKRGVADATGEVKVSDIKGDSPKALDQRAITGSTLLRLSGSFPLPLLGQKEALQEVLDTQAKRGTEASNMYKNSMPERNHIKGLSILLFNGNFSKSWEMSGMERPSTKEVERLASEFNKSGENSNEVTLAFLEQYAVDTAKLAYEVMHGVNPDKIDKFNLEKGGKEFTEKDLLRDAWPGLAEVMDSVQKKIEFGDAIEAEENKKFNNNPNMVVTEAERELVKAIAASTSLRNNPSGTLATYTIEKDVGKDGVAPADDVIPMQSSFTANLMDENLKFPANLNELSVKLGVASRVKS